MERLLNMLNRALDILGTLILLVLIAVGMFFLCLWTLDVLSQFANDNCYINAAEEVICKLK